MADRYLLESGSSDGYLLEDGTGVLLLNNNVAWSATASSLTDYTISSDGLTATKTTATGGPQAIANTLAASGYFEIVSTNAAVGLTPNGAANNNWIGFIANSIGYHQTGTIYRNNVNFATYASFVAGDVIMVALKLVSATLYAFFGKNGTWQSGTDPSAGTGGIDVTALFASALPAISANDVTDSAVGHFTATAMVYPIPTGSAAWDLSQKLTPSLFTNSQTFYTPTVSLTSATLTPDLFTNTQTFFSPTVTPGVVTLTPSLFTNTQTFYAPTVTPGSVTLTPSLFTNAQSFFTPTISPGGVTLTPSLFTNSQTFYSPTVAPGAVTLAPSLFTNSQVFFSPAVAAVINLVADLFTNSQVFYNPTVQPREIILLPDLFTNAESFFSPTVEPGTVTLTPALFINTQIFYAPAVVTFLLPDLFTNTQLFFSPTVTPITVVFVLESRFMKSFAGDFMR